MDLTNQLPSMRESAVTSKKKTSKTQSSSKISEVDLTLSAKGLKPFWDKFCQEISEKLWSATKTDSQGLVLTSSDGCVSNKIAHSWFSAVVTCLQTEKWLKISLPSSMFSVADSTDLVNTNLSSKKIRVYPETLLVKKWRTWIAAIRWCYNQAIAILKTERIGKYELRKRIMDTAPKWVSSQPYNPRQLAIFQALEADKAAGKSQGVAKFRSGKDHSQTIRFPKSNWKSNTFYPRETKGLSFQAAEPILEVMQHEPTLSLIKGQWFICYAVDTILHKKIANYLVSKYKLILWPTVETQQMVKKGKRKLTTKTARAMVTLSHYRFQQTLKHQATKYGCVVVDVTEEYTTKTCSKCGHVHGKLSGSKTFKCPECGHTLDRDLNGAFNKILKALRDTSKSVGLAAFEIMPYTVHLGTLLDLPG